MDVSKVLVVDDHEVVRLGLVSLIQRHPEFTVVGEAGAADEAVQKTWELRPDIVIMDIRMPNGSGIEACREICRLYPGTKVLMLTSYADDEAILASIKAGASGYVLKEIGSQSLISALRSVAGGGSHLDPGITKKVLDHMRELSQEPAQEADPAGLTEQEKKILALIAEGKTNREIAESVFLSEKTVRNYVSSILSKLNLSHRSQAAAYAIRNRLVDPGDRQ